ADDADANRILAMIRDGRLNDARAAIDATTSIPDPHRTDTATERLLVRNEVLFAAIAWSGDGWSSEPNGEAAAAQQRMALLDAHCLELPRSILDADEVVNKAYWRAVNDLNWFLRRDGEEPDGWWLSRTPAAGVQTALGKSELLAWLQALSGVQLLASGP